MKTWWTRQEMIDAKLPGLTSHATITRVAKQHLWQQQGDKTRKRGGRGGGTEIHVSILPSEARIAVAALDATSAEIPLETKRQAVAYQAGQHLSGPQQDMRDARLAILAMIDKLVATSDLSFRQATIRFAALYNERALSIDGWLIKAKSKLSARTLLRWQKMREEGDFDALAGTVRDNRTNTGLLDTAVQGDVKTYVLAIIAKQPHLGAKPIRAAVIKKFGDELEIFDSETGEITYKPCPAMRTFQATIAKWKVEYQNSFVRLTNPDRHKGAIRMVAAGGASARIERLNQLWEIDASPADVMTTDGRMNIYACIDVWSRRSLILVTETPRAEAVGLLVRDAIKKWGLPEAIKTDNGSDFIAKQTKRFLAALGIEHLICDPFSPEQKPHVERFIGTYQRGFTRLLPGFIGHSVADRSIIENRKRFSARLGTSAEEIFEVELSADELQLNSTKWVENVYHNDPHAGLNGVTPAERAATSRHTPKTVSMDALDVLLAPIPSNNGLRQVTKTGIRLNSEHYLIGTVPVGETVFCRMDPSDMGRIFVYDEDGETFFGHAYSSALSGLDPKQAIIEVRRQQKAMEDEQVTPIRKAMRKIKPRDVMNAMIDRENEETVVKFPREKEEISTPELDAADATLHELKAAPVSQEVAELMAEIEAELGEKNAAPAPDPKPKRAVEKINRDTPTHRYNRALQITERLANAEAVTETDARWLRAYRQSTEFKTQKQIAEDFGNQISS